jgi:hypothetical protein
MSWDVMVMKFPEGFDGDFENLSEDWEPEDICTHDYLKNEIKKLFPAIDNDDTTWMTLDEETFSMEFNVGDDDPINCITLHVRGTGQEALKSIKMFCEKLNCQALDTTESEIIDFNEETNKGFSEWQEYRDKVINKKNE